MKSITEHNLDEAKSNIPNSKHHYDIIWKLYNIIDNYDIPDVPYGNVNTIIDNFQNLDEKTQKDFFKKVEQFRKTDEKQAKLLEEIWNSINI